MTKKNSKKDATDTILEERPEISPDDIPESEQKETEPSASVNEPSEADELRDRLAREHDSYLRLAAEYDNFRKRSIKEKEAVYVEVKAETVSKLLPVYDNLERALSAETSDEAFKKGVGMTMTELQKIFDNLGVEGFGAEGDTFDPNLHNAVMHTEDESLGKNVIVQVFQRGFRMGDKVIRFAMVRVAN